MKKFGNDRSWTDYRDILSRSFGINFRTEPVERQRQIRGHMIRYDEWQPAGQPEGTLILVHGGGGNGRVLAPCALPALDAGWRVLAPDLPGYGLSEPAPGYNWDYAEWPAVIAEMADTEAQGPVVLMGLSMGGMTAVFAARKSQRVAGVIATTLIDLSDAGTFVRAARWPWLGKLSLATMQLAPWLFDRMVMPISIATPLKAMSSDPDMQEYFKRDHLLGAKWIGARFFRTLHEYKMPDLKLACPLLLVHPGADNWTPTALSLPVLDRIEAQKQFIALSNGAHLPAEAPAFRELSDAVQTFLHNVARQEPSGRLDRHTRHTDAG